MKGLAKVIAAIFLALVVLYAIGDMMHKPAQTAPQTPAQQKSGDTAVGLGLSIAKQTRNPNSVRFQFAGAMTEPNTYCFQFRTQNGFGGMNPMSVLVMNGKVYSYDHGISRGTPGFSVEWNRYCANKQPIQDVSGTLNYAIEHPSTIPGGL